MQKENEFKYHWKNVKAKISQYLAKYESKISATIHHGWLDYQATIKPLKKYLCAVINVCSNLVFITEMCNNGTEVAISTQRGKSDRPTLRTTWLQIYNERVW